MLLTDFIFWSMLIGSLVTLTMSFLIYRSNKDARQRRRTKLSFLLKINEIIISYKDVLIQQRFLYDNESFAGNEKHQQWIEDCVVPFVNNLIKPNLNEEELGYFYSHLEVIIEKIDEISKENIVFYDTRVVC